MTDSQSYIKIRSRIVNSGSKCKILLCPTKTEKDLSPVYEARLQSGESLWECQCFSVSHRVAQVFRTSCILTVRLPGGRSDLVDNITFRSVQLGIGGLILRCYGSGTFQDGRWVF